LRGSVGQPTPHRKLGHGGNTEPPLQQYQANHHGSKQYQQVDIAQDSS
jgi:hypothetical protein